MAGTIIDRELTGTRARQSPFALATSDDDAAIRWLLRENPMPGRISLSLEREPDYFADAGWPGTERQTIVAREHGHLVCVGNCTVRDRFVNGQPRRVGYLGGLRLDASASGRFDILRRGYGFFQELQAARPADFYFTSIAADNVPARRFLERALPGMPAYEFAGEFVTWLLPVNHRSRPQDLVHAETMDAGQWFEELNEHGRGYQFAPCWSAREWTALSALNLQMKDFCAVPPAGHVSASAMLWDQRAFKQTVIRGYDRWLASLRPAVNLAARLTGAPQLPAIGSTLAYAFVSHLVVDPEKPEALTDLITKMRQRASTRGIEFLTLGFATNDPRLAMLRASFRGREYRSRIYVVRWPEFGGSARDLDARCLGPEVALL